MWAAAYLGLGYAVGSDLEAAASFLTNLSILLLLVSTLTGTGMIGAGAHFPALSQGSHG